MQTKYLCALIQIWIKGEVGLSPPVKYFTDRSKAILLLWIFYVFVLSCVCYVFVRVCLYVLCGHLLGKGWPLGSRLWCLLWVCHFLIGILGQVWYLIVSIPDLCTLTYFFFDLILTYSVQIELHFNHYLVKKSFELAELSRWLPHLSWTAFANYFPSVV